MKLPLHVVLVLCAVAAGIGTLLSPGIPEIAIVLGIALGAYHWLQNIKRSERKQASESNAINC